MAYTVSIATLENSIRLELWESVIRETQGVRMVESAIFEFLNPMTGELVSTTCSEKDVEVFDANKDDWGRALYWKDGRATTNARFHFGDQSDPFWMAVSSIAKKLNAKIVGEVGEVYDLGTGQILER